MTKQVLVTGGLGFIGSHTVVALQESGYTVVIFDNLSNSKLDVVDRIKDITGIAPEFVKGDITKYTDLENVCSTYTFDAVLHFAGLKAVGSSCSQPFMYWEENIVGTMQLLKCMDAFDIRRCVFSSSATVYDTESEESPFDESNRTGHTTNPYGTTKHVIEQLLEDMVHWKQMAITSLRYFNPIGAHSSGLIGEDPTDEPTNLFPILMEVLEGKRNSLQVYGNTYATKDGSGVRDYIHVVDLADAHVKALDVLCNDTDTRYTVYNVGTGTGTSVLEMVELVEKTLDTSVPYTIVTPRDGDIGTSVADVGKIEQELGWKARYSIEQAIEDGGRWRL